MKGKHRYTQDQIEYMRMIAPKCTANEIVEKINEKFNLKLSEGSVSAIRHRNNIRVGKRINRGDFKKGHRPWNKGTKGIQVGGELTQFKAGKEHSGYKPIGSEINDGNGFTLLKVGDPNIWARKHYYLYEEYHGKVPEGYLVMFADGDRENFSADNLIAVTRRQHSRLHRRNLVQSDTELTKVMLNVLKLGELIDKREGK